MPSAYRRPLPDELVAFASPEGRALFREALAEGTMEGYFALAEQHHTQADPAFCGLSSLVVALNALAIDPGRLWKGPWRWFSEELLDCCVPLAQVQTSGLTLDEVACLAGCNGASAVLRRADSASEAELLKAVLRTSRLAAGEVLIASYSRQHLGQTGGGHFSPVAGYHAGTERALVLDVARFKYPPHWVPIRALFEAMKPVDPTTGRSRGWIELQRARAPQNLAFVFTSSGGGWQRIARFLDRTLEELFRKERPETVAAALRSSLDASREAIQGIAFRDTLDPEHQHAVETVLGALRRTRLYALVRDSRVEVIPELATALLYLVRPETWGVLAPDVAAELAALARLEDVEEPLRLDLVTLRAQLTELIAFGKC